MTNKPIRNVGKRFKIILFHLEEIINDWGKCRGLSANDVQELKIIHHHLNEYYEDGKPFRTFCDEISEKEFE